MEEEICAICMSSVTSLHICIKHSPCLRNTDAPCTQAVHEQRVHEHWVSLSAEGNYNYRVPERSVRLKVGTR